MLKVVKVLVKEKIENQYQRIYNSLLKKIPWYYKLAPVKYNKLKAHAKQQASKYSLKLGEILIKHYVDKAFGRTYSNVNKIVFSNQNKQTQSGRRLS